jgi:hypothetical protein
MKYTITQGRIAAIQLIQTDASRCAAVYMGPELIALVDEHPEAVEYDRPMPPEVQAIVTANFRTLFSVPAEQREALIPTIQVQVVQA